MFGFLNYLNNVWYLFKLHTLLRKYNTEIQKLPFYRYKFLSINTYNLYIIVVFGIFHGIMAGKVKQK